MLFSIVLSHGIGGNHQLAVPARHRSVGAWCLGAPARGLSVGGRARVGAWRLDYGLNLCNGPLHVRSPR